MADIQSAVAEIRRGKKERKKEETTGQKYNGLPYLYRATITITTVLSSQLSHCKSSPSLFDECRVSANWPPTLRPSQLTWACCHPHSPSPFSTKAYSCTHTEAHVHTSKHLNVPLLNTITPVLTAAFRGNLCHPLSLGFLPPPVSEQKLLWHRFLQARCPSCHQTIASMH